MAKRGHSDPDFWGGYKHYDEKGRKTGSSRPDFWGGYTEYDAKGRKVGKSRPDFWGGYTHYDEKGRRTGTTRPDFWGGYSHYDAKGHKTGNSSPRIFGGYRHETKEGCYIATCVYGSYDCPEVLALRAFRDQTLKRTAAGRLFIRIYYAVSPKLVKYFGNAKWFRCLGRKLLEPIVKHVRER